MTQFRKESSDIKSSSRYRPFLFDSFTELLHFPFQHPDWEARFLRLTLGSAALAIFVPPAADMLERGFAFQVLRVMLVQGRPAALPDMLDWRQIWKDGFRWWLVNLVYGLPALVWLLGVLAWLYGRFGLPVTELQEWGGWPGLFIGLAGSFILGTVGDWMAQIAVAHMAASGKFAAAFAGRSWGRVLARNLVGFLRAVVVLAIFGFCLAGFQWFLSIPAAALIIGPVLLAAFSRIYQRLIVVAVVAAVYREGLDAGSSG